MKMCGICLSHALLLALATMLPSATAFQATTISSSPTTNSFTKLKVSTSLPPEDGFSSAPSFFPKETTTITTTTTTPTQRDTTESKTNSNVELRTYAHDGWTLKYRYKPAARGKEKEPPLLLIHPVGIGMSSWFWDAFLEAWKDGPAVYAPDLIGCGIHEGSDAWNPEERDLQFPLSWVQGCETLMQTVIQPQMMKVNPLSSFLGGKSPKLTVITQGGLAPVGVMLASRNPDSVGNLIMTSPPTWKDMTTAVPQKELDTNYNFLRSSLGGAAFGALESEWAIRFFSNLFLFQNKADPLWMDQCLQECRYAEARPPIQAFNAGLLQQTSYREELTSLKQPTLIVQGTSDANRIPQRADYATEMKQCQLVTLPQGLNVLPWECPQLFAQTVKEQLQLVSQK